MASELDAFLRTKQVNGTSETTTHIRIPDKSHGVAGGCFFVSEDDLPRFYELYFKDVFIMGRQQSLVEVNSKPNSRLRIDLDFAYPKTIGVHQHTPEQLKEFCEVFMNEVYSLLDITGDIPVYVMEKDRPVPKGPETVGDGIHLLVPDINAPQAIHLQLRKLMLQEMEAIFGTLPLTDKNWGKVYDESILKGTNWQLYGSKKPSNLPYRVRYVMWFNCETLTISKVEPVNISEFETMDTVRRMSARCLSTDPVTKLTELGTRAIAEDTRTARENGGMVPGGSAFGAGAVSKRPVRIQSIEELDEVCDHVRNIKNDADTHYDMWYKVGQALFNLGPDEPKFFDAFMDYSRKSPKHIEADAADAWRTKFKYRSDGSPRVSAGTLRFLSKDSNRERYNEIQENCLRNILISAACNDSAEFETARVVRKMFDNRFRCVGDRGHRTWYEFRGHTWKEMKDGMCVRQLLSTEVSSRFGAMATYYSELRDQAEPESEEYEKYDTLRARFEAHRLKLKKTSFKENVMKECSEVFNEYEFMEQLDENKMLLGCVNGVFDMNTLQFRDGKPDDYICKTTGRTYDPSKPWTELPHAGELAKFLEDIQPDRDMRDYMLNFITTCLCGASYDELFHFMTGGGGNGKSLLFEHLMAASLGDYFALLPVSVATKKRGKSNEATPEMIKTKGARLVVLKEPDEGDPMNTGMIKDLTPGDRITCRGLFKDPVEFVLQAKFLLMCNDKPKVNAKDGGTWRRLRVVHFPVQFVDEPTQAHERPKDGTLKRRIHEWGDTMLALLIQRYIAKRGVIELKPPAKVLEYTQEYRAMNDGLAKFMRDCIRDVDDGDVVDNVTKGRVAQVLRDWKRENVEFMNMKLDDLLKNVEAQKGAYRPRIGWTNFNLVNTYVDE